MIVGGGVIGTSIAFHLAEAGVEDVLLLERAELGSGLDWQGRRRRPRDVLGRAEHADRHALARGVGRVRRTARRGDRPAAGGLPVPALDAPRGRDCVRAQRRAAEPRSACRAGWSAPDEAPSCHRWPGSTACWPAPSARSRAMRPLTAAVQGYAGAARAHGARHPDAHGGDAGSKRGRGCGRTPDRDGLCGVRSGPGSRGVGRACGRGAGRDAGAAADRVHGPAADRGRPPMTIDFASGFYFHREGPGLLFGTNDVVRHPGRVARARGAGAAAARAAAARRADRRRLVGRLRDDAPTTTR